MPLHSTLGNKSETGSKKKKKSTGENKLRDPGNDLRKLLMLQMGDIQTFSPLHTSPPIRQFWQKSKTKQNKTPESDQISRSSNQFTETTRGRDIVNGCCQNPICKGRCEELHRTKDLTRKKAGGAGCSG